MELLADLLRYDYLILHILNVDLAHPVLDQLWLVISHLDRQPWFLYGLLPLLLGWLIYLYRLQLLKIILGLGIAVALSDAICYRILKKTVQRPRPFQNAEISEWVRQVDDAHGPSFPSNHAANCFAGAAILVWYFRERRYLFYNIAAVVALSRVALGVHYPSDVLSGTLLGLFIGFIVKVMLLNRISILQVHQYDSHSNGDVYSWRTRNRRINDD